VGAVIAAHLASRQVTRVVYGAIIGLTLLVTLEKHPPGAGVVIGSLVATALAVAFAEIYAEYVGTETRERHRITRPEFAHMLDDAVAVAFGVAFPGIFFLLSVVGLLELDTAFTLAKWSGLGLIAFYGFCAGRLSGASIGRSLLQAAAVAAIGGAVIAFKALIH
jgi:VIT1/CCC1 family predicted Fe2+/Mn2+ transporter